MIFLKLVTKKDKKLVRESYQSNKSDFAKYSSIFSKNEEFQTFILAGFQFQVNPTKTFLRL